MYLKTHCGAARVCICAALALLLFCAVSCKPDTAQLPDRTVLVYMAADNNLDSFSIDDINEMEAAWTDDINGTLLVYVDRGSTAATPHPCIFRITADKSDAVVSPIVKVYPEQNSADALVFRTVQEYVYSRYPAQSYGLVLWSHGTGWLPVTNNTSIQSSQLIMYSFARDQSEEMDISDLAQNIFGKPEFIIFDACYMGCVEVAYELKDTTKNILFSATEVLSGGYPYDVIVPDLFSENPSYTGIAEKFYLSYAGQEDDYKRSASVSVIETAQLKSLADAMAACIDNNPSLFETDTSIVQEFVLSDSLSGLFYDVGHFMECAKDAEKLSSDGYAEFLTQLEKTVIYKNNTEKFFDQLAIEHFCGMSMYVYDAAKTTYNAYYQTLNWYKDSGYEKVFTAD